jgi:pyrroloquinoline quinone biosynthesis protein B
VGFRLRDGASGRVLAYFAAVGAVTSAVRQGLAGADGVFFDGTFWASDELPALGLGTRRAEQMAHVPIGGPGGSLAALGDLGAAPGALGAAPGALGAGRRVFIHINNTNPLLRDDSPERAAVEAAGWDVAWDGMEMTL